jgi:predicted GNAT family acetyltransferase
MKNPRIGEMSSIRRLVHGDLDALLSLYSHLHEKDEAMAHREQVEAVWSRILGNDDQLYFGGFVRGELVSACNAAVIPNLTRGTRPYALIENVVTHADHRRQGIGSEVMTTLVNECVRRGCYKIMLMSSVSRTIAHEFYAQLGFDNKAKQAFVLSVK